MRHARLDELLALRDGELVDASTREHVSGCLLCTDALERIERVGDQLRALAPIEPAHDRFEEIAAAMANRPRSRRLFGVGVAAAAVLATGLAVLIGRNDPPVVHEPVVAAQPSPPGVVRADVGPVIARSRLLESALAELPVETRRMSARTAGTIAGLEHRIARVDYMLNRTAVEPAPEAVTGQLWQERVDLLNSLWHVRWNEEIGAGLQRPAHFEYTNVSEEK